jgi:hypothetical protein
MAQHAAHPADAAAAAENEERTGRRMELAAAVLLGLAAIATAWSAYWSATFGGDAIAGYSQANTLTSQAADVYGDATGQFNYDRTLFLQYAGLVLDGNADGAEAMRANFFSDNLEQTVAWYDVSGEDVTDPFDDDAGSPYVLEEWAEGNDLSDRADRVYQQAVADDDQGGKFDLATVFLALSLFFGGIATVFRRRLPQLATVGIGTAGLVIGTGAVLWAHLS